MKRNRTPTAITVLTAILTASMAIPQTNQTPISEEYLILGDANRGAGEPMIAINRKDPNNILIVAMATLHRLPNGEIPDGVIPPSGPGVGGAVHSATQRVRELSTQDETVTDIAVSRDGGKTWTFSVDDFRGVFHRNRCHDSFAGAGPDGTLYFGCIPHIASDNTDFDNGYTAGGEPENMRGGSAIAWSNDKGKTWSKPVMVHVDHAPELYAQNLAGKLRFAYASPWDRPYFAADDSTNTIYVSAGSSLIRASHDNGKTWGLIYSTASDDFPGRGGFGGNFSAGHGRFVIAYNATSGPASLNAQCPCPVLALSKDDGKTWEHRLIPKTAADLAAPPPPPMPPTGGRGGRGGGGFPSGGIGYLTAVDPSKDGRIALARVSQTAITVAMTQDGGKSWGDPVSVVELPAGFTIGHRSIKFGPKGDLAVFWLKQSRADYPAGGYDMWTSASRDGGLTFKTVRMSHAVSPVVSRERGNFLFGNDLSTMDIDDQYVHVVWGDNRTGFLGTWYGRIPLSAYR